MAVDSISIQADERGFELHLTVDEVPEVDSEGRMILNIHGVAEELYDAVKAEIGPWLRERDMARNEYAVAVLEGGRLRIEPDEDAYDPTDPKHPRFHSVQSERWDSREGK